MTLNSVLSHTSRLRVPQPAQQYLFSIYIYYLPLCPLRPHTSLGLSRRLVLGAAVTSQCGAGTHLVAWSVPTWLPSGCFVRNIGTTCCTWRQFSGRWCLQSDGPVRKYCNLHSKHRQTWLTCLGPHIHVCRPHCVAVKRLVDAGLTLVSR